jgi:hypothetical protein
MIAAMVRALSTACVLAVALAGCGFWPDGSGGGPQGDDDDGDGVSTDAGRRVDARDIDEGNLTWRRARQTYFTSYPDPGSEECQEFNGCKWAGYFEYVNGQQTEEWVRTHNIAAVHSDDGPAYMLKTLRVKDGDRSIDVTVYDVCSDSDCNGCCTQNRAETGFLIDLESYTAERFGTYDGIVDWACIDC